MRPVLALLTAFLSMVLCNALIVTFAPEPAHWPLILAGDLMVMAAFVTAWSVRRPNS
ncbi:hypothetical protein [Deinococcus ficus]|uniref:hypothetical protein n=1 Tax=Deinococcus ficus TaxID=317577 RepID=UPI000414AEE4|nr:hypothetical protein [Deinococcus ficus]